MRARCLHLTDACTRAMQSAAREEAEGSAARFALDTLLANAQTAARERMAVCQDTGYAVVLAEVGQQVQIEGKPLAEAVDRAVARAYADFRFRKSVCDPITRVNTADNTPAALHTEIVPGDKIRLTFLPKGFGSENMSRLYMLTPSKESRDRRRDRRDGAPRREQALPARRLRRRHRRDVRHLRLSRQKGAHARARLPQRAGGRRRDRAGGARKDQRAGHRRAGIRRKVTALGVLCEVLPTHIAGLPVAV